MNPAQPVIVRSERLSVPEVVHGTLFANAILAFEGRSFSSVPFAYLTRSALRPPSAYSVRKSAWTVRKIGPTCMEPPIELAAKETMSSA